MGFVLVGLAGLTLLALTPPAPAPANAPPADGKGKKPGGGRRAEGGRGVTTSLNYLAPSVWPSCPSVARPKAAASHTAGGPICKKMLSELAIGGF
jgi:hypothetical protein